MAKRGTKKKKKDGWMDCAHVASNFMVGFRGNYDIMTAVLKAENFYERAHI
jgi:hypothetical protein